MRLRDRRLLGATVPGLGTVLALGTAVALAGCGAGQITQTDSQLPGVNGASAQVKSLSIRDAMLQFPPKGTAYATGSSAGLSFTIINDGATDDELVAVSSDAAAGALIEGSKLVVARHSLVIAPSAAVDAPPADTPPEKSSGRRAGPTTGPRTTSSAAPPVQIGRATVILREFKHVVWPGQTVRITLTFRDAGAVAVELPIGSPPHARLGEVHTEAADTVAPAAERGFLVVPRG